MAVAKLKYINSENENKFIALFRELLASNPKAKAVWKNNHDHSYALLTIRKNFNKKTKLNITI